MTYPAIPYNVPMPTPAINEGIERALE